MQKLHLAGIAPEYIAKLPDSCCGQVEMVNSQGIYLQLNDRLLLLCSQKYGVVPTGIAIENWHLLPPLLQCGQPVCRKDQTLFFPELTLSLTLEIAKNDTRILTPVHCVGSPDILLEKTTGLAPLASALLGYGPAPSDPVCRLALPRFQSLLDGIREDRPEAVCEALEGLLGLGNGLTPSADDVLCGLLYGLRHSPLRNAPATWHLTQAICRLAPERTCAVSAACLLALAQDAPFSALAAAWQDPVKNGPALMAIGSNSGSEMLLGLFLARTLI